MRGDKVFRIYGVHGGRDKDYYFGAFRTVAEASARVAELKSKEMNGANWASQYHDQGFAIREADVETDFEIPARPKPRDKFFVLATETKRPGRWSTCSVDVYRRDTEGSDAQKLCTFERGYAMLQTFEPFRQAGREYALISRDYTRTAVLDLASGAVIAEEEESNPPGGGFCPVGFYVPDWWDLNRGDIIPGSEEWTSRNEWPDGSFGFVWGCIWGDDSSWKLEYLDLSRIHDGVIARDARFGYVELATEPYRSPCLDVSPPPPNGSPRPPFIRFSRRDGATRITLAVEMEFDLATGTPEEWTRLKIANME